MEFNMQRYMETIGNASPILASWRSSLSSKFRWTCFFSNVFMHNKCGICVFPSFAGIEHKATFYPHYYCGLLLTISSSFVTFGILQFFPFARSSIPNLKVTLLRMNSIWESPKARRKTSQCRKMRSGVWGGLKVLWTTSLMP